ncbi:hypothetical protein [Aestuariivivens sp. NBU2969]|uniref:hypothetical protein n=1 Tax=Aestuariivivens sp. NBU2969 TaxID=2873267 RepID=UPI001CBDBEBA|nr:hypothetical protein [Aestuariivivens sp. NBU2969]
MKTIRLYRFILLFLVSLFHFNAFGSITFQEPELIRSFDTKFKERYSSRKYNYEGKKVVIQTPPSSGNYEDYKNGKPNIKELNNDNYFSINIGPLNWLFYLALILAVFYLVYILLNEAGTGLFSRGRHKKINHHETITAENIENADIETLIIHAENNNDFRLAIRYYYLLVLKTLSLKNHIKFEDDKTNADYLNEISEKPFSNIFAYTSYLYSYIWYGKFPLNHTDYDKAKHNFVTLLNQME